jgi:high-affinity nickel-transport protein
VIATVSACLFGLASGVRHALEPDHVAAVSTFVAGERSARASMRYAFAWGAGHAVMLVFVAGGLALVSAEIPERIGDALEFVVALLLIGLGVRGFTLATRLARGAGDRPPHAGHPHVRLPFAVGVVHGLAGSGALAALVAARMGSSALGVIFIALYALGAALGMSVLGGVLGFSLARAIRSARAVTLVVGASAMLSLVVGLAWAAPIVGHVVDAVTRG